MRTGTVWLVCLFLSLLPMSRASAQSTFLKLDAGGFRQTITGTFTVTARYGRVDVYYRNASGSAGLLSFAAPGSQPLIDGEYEDARRTDFKPFGNPGMDVSVFSSGCNMVAGRFFVAQFATDATGAVQAVAVDFEQYCDGSTTPLFGSLRYNSTLPVSPLISVARATALKGSVGTNSVPVMIVLSMPSSTPVTVHYATHDGTAVSGVDYLPRSGVVNIPPNVTAVTVPIPVVGDRLARGTKVFSVGESNPSGAEIGDRQSTVTIFDPNTTGEYVALNSQPEDPIGGGQSYLFTQHRTPFFTQITPRFTEITLENSGWDLSFVPPAGSTLVPGQYTKAQRAGFQTGKHPGLDVVGNGRGCGAITGGFTIDEIAVGKGRNSRFVAEFKQNCGGPNGALSGSIRINAPLDQLSVTDAVVTGDLATFSVTLNPPSDVATAVRFATSDGTGVAGLDYVAQAPVLIFNPGETLKTVAVRLRKPAGSGKTFYGRLTSLGTKAV